VIPIDAQREIQGIEHNSLVTALFGGFLQA
jgi:hypothetical protein